MSNSQLTKTFEQLSHGSFGAVQNGQSLSQLAEYLNVERPIEGILQQHMNAINDIGGGIVLLIGNAGDGKSHLISNLRAKEANKEFRFYNDATASCSPTMTSIETLKLALQDFDDDHIETTNCKMLLAINLGKLNDFVDDKQYTRISKLAKAILEDKFDEAKQTDHLRYVTFSNQQSFELYIDNNNDYPVDSAFLKEILKKITYCDESNPFYRAYNETLVSCDILQPEVINFQLLQNNKIQDAIIKMVIESIVRNKLIVTAREFFDFIYSIIIYPDIEQYNECRNFFEALLPTLIFGGGTNKIQKAISRLDPLKSSSLNHNKELALLFTTFQLPDNFLTTNALGSAYSPLKEKIDFFYKNHGKYSEKITKLVFRLKHLLDFHSEKSDYKSFLYYLSQYYNSSKRKGILNELEEMVDVCIPRHYGSYFQETDFVPLNIQGSQYRLFARINKEMKDFEPTYDPNHKNQFLLYIPLTWDIDGNSITLKMDYQLFEYLSALNNGKLSISYESELNLEFSRFIREIIKFSKRENEVVIMTANQKMMTLKSKLNNLISLS